MSEMIQISHIKDGGAQMRVEKINPDIVNEYAEAMLDGAVFPPIVVFFDGADHWLGEGYHRIEAAKKIKRESIDADVRQGTARDAKLYGVGANATHGLRRTQADKRRAVMALITDPEWAQWSDRKIGEHAKVDGKTVAKLRRELTAETDKPPTAEIRTRPKSDGKANGSGSLVADLLRTVSDIDLIDECRRRGLVDDV
jgi:hypothetical protein